MKTLLWGITAALALLWTGLVAAAQQMVDWTLVTLMSANTLQQAGSAVATLPPVPAWLSPWLGGDAQALQQWASSFLQWLVTVVPNASAVGDWVGPLLWIGWGLGILLLLIIAALVHVVLSVAGSQLRRA